MQANDPRWKAAATNPRPKFKPGDHIQNEMGTEGVVESVGDYDDFVGTWRYRVRVKGHRIWWNETGCTKVDDSAGQDLRPQDLKPGLRIVERNNLDWGVWQVLRKYDDGIWEIRGGHRQGDRTLMEGELKFWRAATPEEIRRL